MQNSLRESPAEWREAYADAARWFVDLTPPTLPHLDAPGLGEWTLRDLVGHTSRSLTTVVDYLPGSGPLEVPSAVEYYRRVPGVADPAAVTERGRQAGAALGEDPAGAVAQAADRALDAVDRAADDGLVGSLVGTMALAEYLPTRTFELAVHGCDICVAIGVPPAPPPTSAGSAARLAAALVGDRAGEVLLALTGRRPLPEGFSVLGL